MAGRIMQYVEDTGILSFYVDREWKEIAPSELTEEITQAIDVLLKGSEGLRSLDKVRIEELSAQRDVLVGEKAELTALNTSLTNENQALTTQNDQLMTLADSLMTVEQRLEYINLYPEYAVGKAYAVGEKFRSNGKLFDVIQKHTSQADWTPEGTPALYHEITVAGVTPQGEEIVDFVQPTGAHDAYHLGAKVRFNGQIYESLIDNNAYSPTDYPQGWKTVE